MRTAAQALAVAAIGYGAWLSLGPGGLLILAGITALGYATLPRHHTPRAHNTRQAEPTRPSRPTTARRNGITDYNQRMQRRADD